jgi:hypothetical protein
MLIRLLQQVVGFSLGAFGLLVFVLFALAGELGFRTGRARGRAASLLEQESSSVSTLTTGMLGLVAFTLAVTIGIAQNRFEGRRQATLSEANAIGTAWQRMERAGAPGKPIAGLIGDYARGRLAYLEATSATTAAAAIAHTDTLQSEIWRRLPPVIGGMSPVFASALASSLDDLFGASLVQRYSMESGVPMETMLMLLVGAMLAIGALGYQMGHAGRRQLVPALLLLIMVSGAMVMIVDFNRPRGGFIHVDTMPMEWTIEGFASSPAR